MRPPQVTADNWIEGPLQPLGLPARPRARAHRAHRAAATGRCASCRRTRATSDDVPVAFDGSTTSARGVARGHLHRRALRRPRRARSCSSTTSTGMAPERHAPADVGVEVADRDADRRAGRRGRARPARPRCTEYVAALRGTAWEGCTLQHLLDMRAGTRLRRGGLRRPRQRRRADRRGLGLPHAAPPGLPPDTVRLDLGLTTTARTAGASATARSSPTCSPGWRRRRPGRAFPDLFADRLWSRIGAERDAEIIVDAAGFPAAEGGICTTLRDLARFGLHAPRRRRGRRPRVVPAAWIARLRPRRRAGRRVRRTSCATERFPARLLPRLLVGLGRGGRRLQRLRHQRPAAADPPARRAR